MKKLCLSVIILFLGIFSLSAQDSWTQKQSVGGNFRCSAIGMATSTKGYVVGGYLGGVDHFKDTWEYTPGTNTWVQKADFPGAKRRWLMGFVLNNKCYVGLGCFMISSMNYTFYTDFYEYDPATNIWTQKASFPGTPRGAAFCFSPDGKGYVGGGLSNTYQELNDLWEYDPNTDTWTQQNNLPFAARHACVSFTILKKGYAGLGYSNGYLSDFWEYDAPSDTWTQKANFPGTAKWYASGFTIDNYGYIGAGSSGSTYSKVFYRFDQFTNSWIQIADLTGAGRCEAVSFSIMDKGYIGTGLTSGTTYTNDFWEYTPACGTFSPNVTLIGNTIWAMTSGASYQWLDCDNSFSIIPNETSQSYSPSVSGNYAVIVNQSGCSDTSDCVTVAICDSINTDVVISGPTIYALASGASYQWLDCNNGFSVISNETNQSYSPPVSGNYAVIVTQSGCSDTSDCITVNICDSINIDVVISGPTIYALATGVSYQWLNCNIGFAAIDNETNQSFTPPVNGSYAVIVTLNGCSDTSGCVEISTGISETDNSGIQIYPNPSQGEIIVDLKNNPMESDIELFDMQGKTIKTFPASSLSKQKLDVGDIQNGHYFLAFIVHSKKIYKEITINK